MIKLVVLIVVLIHCIKKWTLNFKIFRAKVRLVMQPLFWDHIIFIPKDLKCDGLVCHMGGLAYSS